jgi:hypothetical protein
LDWAGTKTKGPYDPSNWNAADKKPQSNSLFGATQQMQKMKASKAAEQRLKSAGLDDDFRPVSLISPKPANYVADKKGNPQLIGQISQLLAGSSNPTTSSTVAGSKPLTTGTGTGIATGALPGRTLPFTPKPPVAGEYDPGYMKKGGAVKPKAYASGGCVSSKPAKSMARGGGCEIKGKTKGRYI